MSVSFSKFAGLYGILAGISGLLYFVFFILLRNSDPALSALFLMLLGVFASAAIVAVYREVREVDEGFALWGLLLGIGGAGGAAIHGALDLSTALHPPTSTLDIADPADPRGFMTFAVAGLAAIVLSWLIVRGAPRVFSRTFGYFGLLSGILLLALYIAYLITVSAANPIVVVLILVSGIVQPAWYLWLGWSLWQSPASAMNAKVRR